MVRRWREQTGFSGGPLTHELVIPPGPGGRPGERLMAASRSLYAPRIMRDDSREDFRVLVDDHGSTVSAVCLRPIAHLGEAEEAAWTTLKHFYDKGIESPYEITADRIASETAYGYSGSLRRGVLTEWKLAHAGWLYVIGSLNWAPAKKRDITLRLTMDIFETWEWLPAPTNHDT
jgi:hypothetical protein